RRPGGSLAANVRIVFELIADSAVRIDGGALITQDVEEVRTDANGRIYSPSDTDTPNPWHAIERNDKILPAGTKYRVTCKDLKLDKEITLTTSTLNLATLVAPDA